MSENDKYYYIGDDGEDYTPSEETARETIVLLSDDPEDEREPVKETAREREEMPDSESGNRADKARESNKPDDGDAAPRERKKRNGKKRRTIFGGDKVLWIIIVSLLIMSIYVTFSALIYKEGTPAKTVLMQLGFIFVGVFVLWVVHLIKIQFYSKFAKALYIIGLVLTLAAWARGLALGLSSSRDIPLMGISIQPFEILKIGMVMILAQQLARRQKDIADRPILPSFRPAQWKRDAQGNVDILVNETLPLLGPIALTCIVTFLAVGNSTTMIIALTCLVMLFIGRVRGRDLLKIVGGVGIAALILLGSGLGRTHTAKSRMAKFNPRMHIKYAKEVRDITPDGDTLVLEVYAPPVKYDDLDRPITETDQSVSAKMSIASGELLGKGPGMSTHRSDLPEAEKDYAYAFLIEEYGALGGIFVLLLFLWLFFRTIQIFKKCGTAFPSLLILGLGVMITLQALMHMMVSVGLFPVAGQQLPLISKGGSSLVANLFALGMILGVSRQTAENTLDRPKNESLFEKQ